MISTVLFADLIIPGIYAVRALQAGTNGALHDVAELASSQRIVSVTLLFYVKVLHIAGGELCWAGNL